MEADRHWPSSRAHGAGLPSSLSGNVSEHEIPENADAGADRARPGAM